MPENWHKEEIPPQFKPKLGAYFWQIPAILLTGAILLFAIGLNIWVFQAAARELTWGDDKKVWNSSLSFLDVLFYFNLLLSTLYTYAYRYMN
jgi:hypothetical protein